MLGEKGRGLEPSTSGSTIQYSGQLSYSHHVAEPRGVEPRSMDFQSIAYTTSAKAPSLCRADGNRTRKSSP